MRKLLLALGFSLLLAGTALAGGGEDFPPQQQMAAPQTKVVVVQPANNGGSDWVAPVAVAVVTGVFGLTTAVVVNRRRKK